MRKLVQPSLRAQRSNPSLRLPRYGLLRCARNDGEGTAPLESVARMSGATSGAALTPSRISLALHPGYVAPDVVREETRRCKAPAKFSPISGPPPAAKPAALDALTLTGDEPQLPSSFRVAAAAQVSVAATGLAAAGIWKMRSGEAQDVAVDMRHAVVECRSERYLRVDGKPPPPAWDAIAGVYKTRDRLRAPAHQFSPSPRRRLQGAELQAGA